MIRSLAMQTAGIALLSLNLIASFPAQAQAGAPALANSDIVDRFYKAREVINAAVQAGGGAPSIRGFNAVSLELEGDVFNDLQGYSASKIGQPARDSRQRVRSQIDWAGSRFAQTVLQRSESGFDSAFATIWAGGTAFAPRWVPRDYAQTDNSPSPFQAGGAAMVASRLIPPAILKRALQNVRSAYWVGTGAITGEATDIVDFSFDEVTRFRIHVVRTSRLLRRVETIAPDPVAADDAAIANFSGEQIVGGLHFPQRIQVSRRGFINQDFAVQDVAVNPQFVAADFAPPEGFARQPPGTAQLQSKQVAGRVYEVSGLAGGTYQVPFVVMDDFVVAFEAPLGIGPSRQIIAEIRKIAPDKPIKYVVVSHFHADHAGGVGAFVEAGATILSSANNREVLETYARANRPQSQGQEGIQPGLAVPFEAVPPTGRTITDRAGGKLQVIDFPGNSHVENMLALFDPQARVLMGADHYIEAVAWNPTFERVAKWVRRNRGVDQVLGTHIRPLSRAEFLAKASGPKPKLDPPGPAGAQPQ